MINWKHLAVSVALPCIAGCANSSASVDDYDVLQYINPLIGSANGGMHEVYPVIAMFRARF